MASGADSLGFNEYGPLRRVALRHPRAAFGGPEAIAASWRALGYGAAPDFARACADYDRFAAILAEAGAAIDFLPAGDGLTLDSLYVRDAALISPRGIVLASMGKAARDGEPDTMAAACAALGMSVAGRITGDGRLEGGDLVWLDEATCAVGQGYRSNDEGIRQLKALLGPRVELVTVPLPHYKGPDDVFHLMSIVSPLDADLALVHSPLMPVVFRDFLLARGFELVEVAGAEFETLGCNALALGPRRCLMAEGNPQTRARLESLGCEVLTYDGAEISLRGQGGPTCLTRPLVRG
jgi:N-dimethylarginine dimethylaminohydrolase